MQTQTFETHPKTDRPIQPTPNFQVGDAVTISIRGDSYPALVVDASKSGKTVWARPVEGIRANDATVDTGWESSEVILDPEEIELALAVGRDGAEKFVHYVSPRAHRGNGHDDDRYGGTFHAAGYRSPNGGYFRLSAGARTKRDPHV